MMNRALPTVRMSCKIRRIVLHNARSDIPAVFAHVVYMGDELLGRAISLDSEVSLKTHVINTALSFSAIASYR